MRSKETSFEPISTQAVILEKSSIEHGFRYTLKYTGANLANRVPNTLITSEGAEMSVDDMVHVYAAAQAIEGGHIESILQVVGLVNRNRNILFDGSKDDPYFEDTTTSLPPSVALVGTEARLNMYDDCGIDPWEM